MTPSQFDAIEWQQELQRGANTVRNIVNEVMGSHVYVRFDDGTHVRMTVRDGFRLLAQCRRGGWTLVEDGKGAGDAE